MPQIKPPNIRTIDINKETSDRLHRYTVNNLEAVAEAARRLTSVAGFKLYMYLAKNQNNYSMLLYSSSFLEWANVGIAAYNTAFKELVKEGFLVPDPVIKDKYNFYDRSQYPEQPDPKHPQIVIMKEITPDQ